MPDLTTLAAKAATEGGILPLVYKDLAQPGVKQVGEALKTVLSLGNSLLLPLRLLNETARKFEERKFEEIASRFSKIPDEELIDVSPELGVPILDHLSHTEDPSLREMFVELLGKAATSSQVAQAHPSFVHVISSLSPDEAILINALMFQGIIPFISIEAKGKDGSASVLKDFILHPPNGLSFPNQIPLYLSNMAGLGLIEFRRNVWLTAEGTYDAVKNYAKEKYKFPDKIKVADEEQSVEADRHVIVVLPYGKSFAAACANVTEALF